MADTYASEDWSAPYPTSPQSSFEQPVAIPAAGPSAEPVVCIPVSAGWLRLLHGAIDQLRQPTTWAAATDADMFQALAWVEDLQLLVAMADDCMRLRWSDADCAVEQSTDGGATWAKISGWPIGPPGCFVGATGPAGATGAAGAAGATGAAGAVGPAGPASIWRLNGCNLQYSNDGGSSWATASGWDIAALQGCLAGTPGNPQSVTTLQAACNIASWLVDRVLLASLSTAASNITGGLSLLASGTALMELFAVFTGVGALLWAAVGFFSEAAVTIGATTLNAAASDTTLAANLRCAVFNAIRADGQVTAGNFSAVHSAILGVSYGTPGVIGLLGDYWNSFGYAGIASIQAQGSLYVGDCSGCASCFPFVGTSFTPITTTGLANVATEAQRAPALAAGFAGSITATLTPGTAVGFTTSASGFYNTSGSVWWELGVDGSPRFGNGGSYITGIGPFTGSVQLRVNYDGAGHVTFQMLDHGGYLSAPVAFAATPSFRPAWYRNATGTVTAITVCGVPL